MRWRTGTGTVKGRAMAFELSGFDLVQFVAATLAEDLGPTGRDVTSESVIPADACFSGVMDSRDAITVAGLPIAAACFPASPIPKIFRLQNGATTLPQPFAIIR